MKGKNNAISKFEQSEIEGQREIENVYYELEHKMPVEEINKKIIEMKRDNERKKITQNEDRRYNRKYEHRRIELQRK
jgi:predicted transglutaminase-like protease